MNHENSWTISDILKQLIESTDRDWTFIGEGEILERIRIVVTKFRFFANFLTHFLSKKRVKKWWKNGPFFDSVLVQKLDQFRIPFSLLFWFFWQTETSELYEVWLRRQTRFDFCEAWLEKRGQSKKWSKFKLNPKSYSGVYYIFKKKIFQIPLFTGFLLISLYNIWLFSENIDFEKNSLKNQPLSNFVLISGFFVKTEKNADTTPKFTQNREENHKTIG